MINISTIFNPLHLIENEHINLYGIDFDDNSLRNFLNIIKQTGAPWVINNIRTIKLSKRLNETQRELLTNCFVNLKL
jgi:hypothetical protein